MPRPLSEEIDAAVREVECVKVALSNTGQEDGASYLGMSGQVHAERLALLQLLHLSLSSVDRLREKEIEVLKASTADAAAAGRCTRSGGVDPPPSTIAGASSTLEARGEGQSKDISDVKTWVACRALLDSFGVGELRLVDSPVPRAELSVPVDALPMFQWPGAEERSAASPAASSTAAPAVFSKPERAGLAAYLNAVLPPGGGNSWIVPSPAATAAAASDGNNDDDADFLSTPLGRGWRTQSPLVAGGGETAAVSGVLRGGAPAAALCLSEAVSCGGPSLGLRVLLEIVRPVSTPAGEADPLSSGSVADGSGKGGQAALYRAIAVLLAANRRSPLTRPVVVLTDLRGAWKILWLGGARSGVARRGEGREVHPAAATATATFGEEPGVDVFVWRLNAADAASVVRSMLNEESVSWDGQVSWAHHQAAAAAAAGGQHDLPGGAEPRENTGGRARGGVLSGPMAALRDRHRVGRVSQRQHGARRRSSSFTAYGTPAAAAAGNSNHGGTEGVEHYIGGITRTMSPPLAMEMALRRGGSSSFTGHSSTGQRMAGGSQGDVGEHQPRESRALSFRCHNGSGVDRPKEMGRATFWGAHVDAGHSFDERFGSGGGHNSSSIGHHSNDYLANGGYANSNHAASNGYSGGGALPLSFRGYGSGGGGGDGDSRSITVPPPPPPPPPLSPRSPLAGGGMEPTILRHLLTFVAGDGFLFVAGVSRGLRDAWGVERPPETTIDAAVESPSRLGWARASGLEWGANVCARAAAGGHLATLRYARALKCPWDWRTCAHAATKALVPVREMIQWAASQPAPRPGSPSTFVMDDPVRPRRLQVLQWCRENGCAWDEATASEAAREGNMDILRYARRNGCPWNVLTCAYAAASGNLETLKWAREEEGCGWNEATCAFAAAGGHVEVLKWARSKGCPWGEETCASAARGGRLKVLQWCRASGCPWGGGTCANAAEGGHLEILKWARAQDCPWTEATCTLAAREGQFEILKWSRDNGCPWASATFRAAAGTGNMDMLRFLFERGCPWDRRTCASAARNSDLEALKFLRLNGCPWDSRTLDAAAEVGAMELFDWARKNGCPSK